MPIVTFLSDFGWQDHYVAAVKAKILSESAQIPIVDISHNIKKFDIIQTAHLLKAVYRDFPEGSIHLVATNTNNQKNSEMIALSFRGHYFLGSNNGIFSLVEEKDPDELVVIKTEMEHDVFPAKNVLAGAAVKLFQKEPLSSLGESMPLENYQKYMPQRVKANRELIQGHVVHIDGYGNLITNIDKRDYDILSKDKSIVVKFRNYGLTKVLNNYFETQGGEAFALFNSSGMLEIGIKEGNASQLLGMEYGSMVSIKFNDY